MTAANPSFRRDWTFYIFYSHELPWHLFGRQKSLEHSQGATWPPPDNASVLGMIAQSPSKREENTWWRGKYQQLVRHQESGVCCQDRWTQPAARSKEGLVYISEQRNDKFAVWGSPKRACPIKHTVGWTWSFPSGAFSVHQKESSGTCGEGDSVLQYSSPVESHTKSDESKTWIHLCWFLGINDYSWKCFLELQTPLVFCKVSKGDPNTRWNHDGDFPVLSLRENDRAGRFWTCSFFLPGLVACAETHPLNKLLIWCLRVFSTVHFCRSALFNECEQNLSADTNTWIQVHILERILHPMKRRWPVMQHVWDLHQIWFIRVFSSHSFFPG